MSPVFAHGQLRLYLLALLVDGPRHGYDLIRDLETTFDGLYSPSAGTVYPRLAKLEEEGLIERLDEGRKSPYRITEAGRAEVAARQQELADIRRDISHSIADLAETVRRGIRERSVDVRAELREAAKAARAAAVPVGGSGRSRGSDRAASAAAAGRVAGHEDRPRPAQPDVERMVNDFRAQLRSTWRSGRPTADQVQQIASILRRAGEEIRAVVEARPAGDSGPAGEPTGR